MAGDRRAKRELDPEVVELLQAAIDLVGLPAGASRRDLVHERLVHWALSVADMSKYARGRAIYELALMAVVSDRRRRQFREAITLARLEPDEAKAWAAVDAAFEADQAQG